MIFIMLLFRVVALDFTRCVDLDDLLVEFFVLGHDVINYGRDAAGLPGVLWALPVVVEDGLSGFRGGW